MAPERSEDRIVEGIAPSFRVAGAGRRVGKHRASAQIVRPFRVRGSSQIEGFVAGGMGRGALGAHGPAPALQ